MKLISLFCFAILLSGIPTTHHARAQATPGTSPKAMQSGKITKAYNRAISEYIEAVYKSGAHKPDTLYVGKNGDIPDISLHKTIQGINIVLLKNEDAQKRLIHRSSFVYLNVASWINKHESEFLIVTFYDFKPQYHTTLYLKHNAAGDEMQLDSLGFQYPYGRK